MTKFRREPYAKLYASWHSHPRTGPLSLAASGLEARMMSWSVCHGTNGSVPRESVATAAPSAKPKEIAVALAELVARGVLEEYPDGYVIRDFLDANISKERDEERRGLATARKHKQRSKTTGGFVTRDNETVTRDKSICHTEPLDHDHDHDHDGGEAPPPPAEFDPPETLLRDRVVHRWRVTFEAVRRTFPTADDKSAREVVTWLRANAANVGKPENMILDECLDAYWREDWPRDPASKPRLANFLSQLDRLLAVASKPAAAPSAPVDFEAERERVRLSNEARRKAREAS